MPDWLMIGMERAIELGTCHLYSEINGWGYESLNALAEVAAWAKHHGVEWPAVAPFLQYRFEEKRGWGEPFDPSELRAAVRGHSRT
jgi:hypothetical protein